MSFYRKKKKYKQKIMGYVLAGALVFLLNIFMGIALEMGFTKEPDVQSESTEQANTEKEMMRVHFLDRMC